MKDLERRDSCPRKWKAKWLEKIIEQEASVEMLKGQYMETLCIGSGAHGTLIEDLPRLKSGDKSADQLRIDQQAEAFKRYFDPSDELYLGFKIVDTQVVVSDGIRQGVIDIVAEDEDGVICHIDLKATSNVENTFGDYSWGNPENMDFIQQTLYSELYKKQTGIEVVRVFLLVFDWSPNLGKKLIELDISNASVEDCSYRFSEADRLINEYEEDYWPTVPSRKECSGCPVECGNRFNELNIEKLKITV